MSLQWPYCFSSNPNLTFSSILFIKLPRKLFKNPKILYVISNVNGFLSPQDSEKQMNINKNIYRYHIVDKAKLFTI